MTKTINEIEENAVLDLVGDTEITCDVPNGVTINMSDGNVTILSLKVGDNVTIKAKSTRQSFNAHGMNQINISGTRGTVIVNGQVMSNNGSSSQIECSINISAKTGDNVTLEADNDIILNHNGETLTASAGNNFSALSCGNNSRLSAGNKVTLFTGGSNVSISAGSQIACDSIDQDSKLSAGNNVVIKKSLGENSSLTAGNTIKIPVNAPENVQLSAGNKVVKGGQRLRRGFPFD